MDLGRLMIRRLVGVDLGASGIKAVELHGQKLPKLLAYNRIPLPWDAISRDGEIRSRDTVVGALKRLFEFQGFSTKRVAVGLCGSGVIVKRVSMAKMEHRQLLQDLYWEAEQYLPFDIQEVNVDFAILGPTIGNGDMMDVLLVAAKKEYVQSVKDLFFDAGLKVEIIDHQMLALSNAYEYNYGYNTRGTIGIIDFGASSTKISVIENDRTIFSQEVRLAGNHCSALLAEKLGISGDEAERLKINAANDKNIQTILIEFRDTLIHEVTKTIGLALNQSGTSSLQSIFICGGAAKLKGLSEVLSKVLETKVLPLNPVQNIPGDGKKMDGPVIEELRALGTVAVGLALRTPGDRV